ncbi:hypothetical protein F5Y06DRAFT_297981 [Hypoxylon sp. FL0890]|nr:hypothetical protein F5Y06DRAFT_297981 [Hypoxylon sp. FL0890]
MAEEEASRDEQFSSNSSGMVQELLQVQSNKSWRKQRDRDEYNDYDHDQQHSNKKRKTTEAGSVKLLACPFYKRDRRRLCNHRSCNGPGWNSISRLKEHLYRTHFALRCQRCKSRFQSSSDLENHYQNPIPCMVSPITPDPMEGFNEAQRERLKSRNLQDWKQIYRTLFPDDDETSIPSPHYSNAITISAVLDKFDRDYQREVERLIPERLSPILVGHHLRHSSAIQGDILAVVSDIHSTVIQSFKQRTIGLVLDNSGSFSRSTVLAASASTMEPNLDSPVCYWGGCVNSLSMEDESTQSMVPNLEFDTSYILDPTVCERADQRDDDISSLQGGPPLGLQGGGLNTYALI